MFHYIFKKKVFLFLLAFLFIFLPQITKAENIERKEKLYIFSSPTCSHCQDAKIFLADLEKDDSFNFSVQDYTLANNVDLVKEFYIDYKVPKNYQGLVPIIFVGDRYFVGFSEDIGNDLSAYLQDSYKAPEPVVKEGEKIIKLPWLGEINLLNFSLPVLAITLGIVDGFNVCSLGALVLILGLVIALHSRKKIFVLGFTFLITTAVVYGVMIFIWHRLFSLLAPYVRSLELLIGVLSIVGGIYLLKEFYQARKNGPICSSNNILSRLAPKVEKIFQNKTNWWLLVGVIILFSGAVTIIEFPCSAVLPVLFSGILVEAGLSQGLALSYIALFILFYLLDEIIVFLVAVLTMKIKIVSPRFIVFFNLLAAFIFLALGIFYLLGLSL